MISGQSCSFVWMCSQKFKSWKLSTADVWPNFFAIGHKWQHKCDKWTESQNNTVTTGGSGQLQLNKLSKFFRFFSSFPILEGRMINCAWTMLCFYTTIKLGSLLEFPVCLLKFIIMKTLAGCQQPYPLNKQTNKIPWKGSSWFKQKSQSNFFFLYR